MTTIVGAQLRGFTNPLAADFSFLLAIPTLGAATLYSLYKSRDELMAIEGSAVTIPLGILVAFLVAWAAIAGFLAVVKRVGMSPFGVYRILVGAVILVLYLGGRMS
jgi:undecaprenyl-diphosphatase